jgi:hypothetical protein
MRRMEILGYDRDTAELKVDFESDKRYDFYEVPGSLYDEMRISKNPTDYFHAYIWNRFEHRTYWRDLDALLDFLVENNLFEPPMTVNTHRSDGQCTPLYEAVYRGYARCVGMLLRAGASPDVSNRMNTTPRKTALQGGKPKIMALFP